MTVYVGDIVLYKIILTPSGFYQQNTLVSEPGDVSALCTRV